MREKNLFWDNCKGILILLIVFGNLISGYANYFSDGFVKNLYILISTFHMPAFIFCFGYFSQSEDTRSREAQARLLLYYVVFNTLMGIFRYFYMGSELKILTPYYSYWFIISLLIWNAGIGKLSRVKGILILSVVAALAMGYWREFSNLLSLRRTVAYFVFFAAGYRMDREKTEHFLVHRKPWQMALCAVVVAVGAVVSFWVVNRFGITNNVTIMGAYKIDTDILRRIMLLMISGAVIVSMFLVIPGCKIPLLSKLGKNALLIYSAYRFVTLVYNRELFSCETYQDRYLLYAAAAAVLICVVFGSNRLNQAVTAAFDKAIAKIFRKNDQTGQHIITMVLVLTTGLLCIKAVPQITELAVRLVFGEETSEETVNMLSAEQEAKIEDAVKIAYVGDLILLKDQVTSAYDDKTETYHFDAMFEYAAPYLTEADLAIGVFEGPAAGKESGYSTSNFGDGLPLYLNFPDEFAQAVKDAGIDLVTVATNHLLDRGLDGAERTLDVLDEVGLLHTGAYRDQEEKDRLLVVEVEGIKIAVLSYVNNMNYYETEILEEEMPYLTSIMPNKENKYYEKLVAEIEEDFAQAKASDPDVILVMAHMGTQFKTSTNRFQREWNARFAELGADIILGDHAHIVQPIEYIEDTVVVNCPGNFANSYIAYNGDTTAMVELYIDRDTKDVIATSVIPMYTHEVEKGYFRALPIYDIMTNTELYDELWSRDLAKIQESHQLVTKVMLGEAVELKDAAQRYFYIDNLYYQTSGERS